jgi:hypothetical protein
MDADPIATAVRRHRRRTRLGPNSVCFFCGYSDPVALMARSRTLLQKDHSYGRKRNPDSIIALCRNCHAEITEDRMREEVPMRRERDPIQLIAFMLKARAVYLKKDATTMEEMANTLLGDDQ